MISSINGSELSRERRVNRTARVSRKKLEKREGIDLLFFTLSGSGLQTKQIASVPPKVIKERRKLRVEWGGGGALRLPAEQVFLAKTEE